MKKLFTPLIIILTLGTSSAQDFVSLSGKVFDSGTRDPLPECNVYLSDFNYGTVTDSLGCFSLRIPAAESDQYLIISFVGYLKFSVKVSEITATHTIVNMNPEIKFLDEIIVTEKTGEASYDYSGLPWNYREIDKDYAGIESPEVHLDGWSQ